MKISRVICRPEVEDKLLDKHDVTLDEVEQILFDNPHIRFIECGHRQGQDVYAAYGQTIEGRYLIVFFIAKSQGDALLLSARDMANPNEIFMNAQDVSSISQATTDDQIAEFWDTHSTAEFWDQTHEVDITFDPSARLYVVIEPELLADIRRIARAHRVSTQTLINLWLRQKADQVLLSQK